MHYTYPGFKVVPRPFPWPMSKYGMAGGYPIVGGGYPVPGAQYAYPQVPGYAAQSAPAQAPATPVPAPYMTGLFPGMSPYEPREARLVLDLAEIIGPALDRLIPAIEGLIRIPSLMLEQSESAGLLARWDDLVVTLTPEVEEPAENPPSALAPEAGA